MPFTQLRKSFERFVSLSDDAWEEIKKPWVFRTVRRGEVLTREGQTERFFALVLDGVQRLHFLTQNGEDHNIGFTYPYNYSGVPDSFFLQTPSSFNLEALTDGKMLTIDHENMLSLMDRYRELDRWAWRLLASAGAGRFRREQQMLTMTAEERYDRLFREAPHLFQLVPLHHLASYLGMRPETLSRIRAVIS